MKIYIILCTVSLFFISCGSGSYMVKYQGDDVEIVTLGGLHVNGELVALSDTCAILISKEKKEQAGRILSVKLSNIKSIEVKGYSSQGWKTSVVLTQLVPAVVVGITASTVTDAGQGLGIATLLSIPALITYLLYDAASPDPPQWDSTQEATPIANLNKYARMPQGMSEEQLQELLKHHKQTSVIEADRR